MTRQTPFAKAVLGLGLVLMMALSACSPNSAKPDATPTPTQAAASNDATDKPDATDTKPTEDPAKDEAGVLVMGVTSDPDTLFPWKATQFTAIHVLENIYGGLTEFDTDLNVVPGVASEWKTSDDGTSVVFTLDPKATFADGSAVTSEDVVFSLEAIRDEKTAAVGRSGLSSVTNVAATDEHTVTLTLSAPDAALPANLAGVNMAILKKGASEADLKQATNGTGAFTMDSRKPGQNIVLKRNEKAAKPAKLAQLEFRIIPDETSIVSALESGNVHMAVFNDPLVAKTAEKGDVQVKKTPQLSYHALQLNATKGALTDEHVRLAIQCAIDRQEVLDTAAMGEGEITGPITSPAFKSDPSKRPCPTKDVDKAKEYLAKSGKKDVTIKTIVSQGEYASSVNEAQNVKAQLEAVGIKMDLEVMEIGAFVKRWIAADFEAAIALNGGRPDPESMYGRYFISSGNLNKVAGYSSPELDKLFTEGKISSDPAKRKEIYAKVSEELENHAAWIWMFTSYTYTAMNAKVKGYTPMTNGSFATLRETTLD